jgi:hypothetical protein
MKWTSEGLKRKEVKLLDSVLKDLSSQHNTFKQLTNHWDGEKAVESLAGAVWSLFGGNVRQDLKEKVDAIYAECNGAITPANYSVIFTKLTETLTWAKENIPIKDERRPAEELKANWEKSRAREGEARQSQAEFEKNATVIPAGKRGVSLEVCFDNSDAMTDYFDRHHTLETRLLAIIPDGREDERGLRNVIDRIPALKAVSFEWHTEKYSMGHGNYLESKTCPETRKHPYQDHQINCHYEIRYLKTYGKDGKAIAHPEWYQGDLGASVSMASGSAGSVTEVTIRKNAAMNGIEILFPAKPDRSVIETIKGYGFRWSQRQGLWWKRYSASLLESIKTTFPTATVEGFDVDPCGACGNTEPRVCGSEACNPV